jgi:hypothetical protein
MEHSFAPPLESVHQWRRAAFAAGAVAAVELVVLVGIGAKVVVPKIADHLHTAAAHKVLDVPAPLRPKTVPPGKPKLARSETSVTVLNGNGRAGAASEGSARINKLGYIIGSVGNAQRSDYRSTVVMFRPGYRAEGARLGRDLHVKNVAPLDGIKARDLMGAHLAVILGP